MTPNNTTKIVTLLAVLIVSAIMSGCIDLQSTVDDITAIPIQNTELTREVTPEVAPELAHKTVHDAPPTQKRHVAVTVSQRSDSLLVTVQGGDDYQQLREIQVIVNNETLDIYIPEYQVQKTIQCTTIGRWKVVCRGIFEDGGIQTIISTNFGGLSDSYVETTIAPERYVEPSTGTSREEAKRICEENGVVWGCDDPTPIPTQIVTPTPTPTPDPIPTVTPTNRPHKPLEVWATESYIGSAWAANIAITNHIEDEIIFRSASIRYHYRGTEASLDQLKLIKVYVDRQLVATITPDLIDNPRNTGVLMNNTCIIKLPDGLTNSGEITAEGTFVDLISDGVCDDLVDGEYMMHVAIRKTDDEYTDYPIYQG